MSASEHTLEAVQALQRARQALDILWRDCRLGVPTPQEVDRLVFGVTVEIIGALDALELAVETELGVIIDSVEDVRNA